MKNIVILMGSLVTMFSSNPMWAIAVASDSLMSHIEPRWL